MTFKRTSVPAIAANPHHHQSQPGGWGRFVVLTLFIILSSCSETPAESSANALPTANPATPEVNEKTAKLTILFVGNSLTFSNDLPGLLKALIRSTATDPVYIETCTFPNFGLVDHWKEGSALKAIERIEWDFVIIQQGPSATEGRPSLLEYTKLFAEKLDPDKTRLALYQVWPSSQRDFDFDGVCESYRMAAKQNDAMLLPVGEAWRLAWQRDPEIKLYGRDGFHPSMQGSYLAALVMYQQLTGQSPVGLPGRIDYPKKLRLSPEVALLLQEAAVQANELDSPPPPRP